MLKCTLCFQSPYWMAQFEKIEAGELRLAQVILGPEPSLSEFYHWQLTHYPWALTWTRASAQVKIPELAANPKRRTRQAARARVNSRFASESQEIWKAELEASQRQRKAQRKARKMASAEARRALKIAKRKERHRGH